MKYVAWGIPNKAELMKAAVLTQLQTELVTGLGWTAAVRAANQTDITERLDRDTEWPVETAPTAILLRGSREPFGDELKGTTQGTYEIGLELVVLVHDPDSSTRDTTLGQAEAEAVNAIHQLQRDVHFNALARNIRFTASAPVAIEAEGDAPPYAGTVLALVAQVYE